MPEERREVPLIFLYLDVEGIESLYAQTTERVETEFAQSHSKEGHGGVRLKVGIGSLLTTLLGLKEAAAETNLETVRGHIEEAKSKLSVEHKLERLAECLIRSEKCFLDLGKAAASVTEPGRPVYIRIEDKFDAPDFFNGRGNLEAINSSKSIVFTIENRYDESDNYFKRSGFSFTMPASLDKFPRFKGYFAGTSHEARFFRGLEGRNIPLGVFGYVLRYNSLVCQIKPYAIWLLGGFR